MVPEARAYVAEGPWPGVEISTGARAALAERVGIHASNIRRYEAGSADSLLFADDARGPDDDLRLAFEATRNLDDEKDTLKALLEGFLLRHDARRWTNVS